VSGRRDLEDPSRITIRDRWALRPGPAVQPEIERSRSIPNRKPPEIPRSASPFWSPLSDSPNSHVRSGSGRNNEETRVTRGSRTQSEEHRSRAALTPSSDFRDERSVVSLAFDTIYAEGAAGTSESPPPTRVSSTEDGQPDSTNRRALPSDPIEQKTTHRNPRLPGNGHEIYDYLRLLYAGSAFRTARMRKGDPGQSVEQIIDTILSYPEGTKNRRPRPRGARKRESTKKS
jgi:hypothetical protein